MNFYENGYEKRCDLAGAAEVRTSFLSLRCRLYMVGTMQQKRRAADYLRRGLALCRCEDDEFRLHFMCEQVCGVRIVREDLARMTA